jgi:NADH-quinone oxidoreductase subunit M
VVAIIYTSLIAIVQKDIKKLIAYSSVAHMGFVTIGIFSANLQGLHGAIIQMISHGIISAALFFCIGSIYERYKTKQISNFGGLGLKIPKLSIFFLIFTLGAIGFPGTSGFVGEFLTLISVYSRSTLVAFLSAFGVILAATYMLLLYKNVFLGPVNSSIEKKAIDLNFNELFTFLVLSLMILIIGIKPNFILSYTTSSLDRIITLYPITIF